LPLAMGGADGAHGCQRSRAARSLATRGADGGACQRAASARRTARALPCRPRPMGWPGSALVALHLTAGTLSSVLPVVEAGDLLSGLKHLKSPMNIKPPARLLEEGKLLGRTIQQAAEKNPEEASKVVDSVQKAVGVANPADLEKAVKVELTGLVPKEVQETLADRKVQEALRNATPKLAEALRHTDPDRIVEALQAADPRDVEEVFDIIGAFRYWKKHKYDALMVLVVLISTSVLAWRVLCRRSRRRKHPGVEMEQSEQGLLELEAKEPMMFVRAAPPASP